MSYRSIVEWVGGDGSEKEKGSKCGYCKSKDTCFTDDGIWAHWMKPGDYQVQQTSGTGPRSGETYGRKLFIFE